MFKFACFLMLLVSCEAGAVDNFITPPKRIVKLAKQLAYPDFPTYLDILAVIRVESAYRTNAINPEKGIPSVGIMQVRGGSKDLDKNMIAGTGLLRQYYKRLDSSENAIRSYNVGIGTFKAGKAKISADQYYKKFLHHRKQLEIHFRQ